MTEVNRRDHGYVSPYLMAPVRSLAEAERDRQADAATPVATAKAKLPANDDGKR